MYHAYGKTNEGERRTIRLISGPQNLTDMGVMIQDCESKEFFDSFFSLKLYLGVQPGQDRSFW